MQRTLFLALLSTLLFIGLALPAARQRLFLGDELLYSAIQAERSPLLNSVFRAVTKAGSKEVLVPVGVAVFLWKIRHPRLLLFLVFYSLGVALLETGAKSAVARPRPSYYLMHGPLLQSSPGFPSGHALAATAFYGMLLVLLYKSVRHQRWQQGITGGILLLILLVGCSRIYLGMHWLSDVLGGYALGGAYCLLASTVYARLERGAKVPDDLDER